MYKRQGLISEKNFATAQQWIDQLENLNLPEGYGDQVSNLQDLLDKAKQASDALNSLGGN